MPNGNIFYFCNALEDTYNTATVKGYYSGGLVGYNENGSGGDIQVHHTYNIGSIHGFNAGGLVGHYETSNTNGSLIKGDTLSNNYNSGNVYALLFDNNNPAVGGIIVELSCASYYGYAYHTTISYENKIYIRYNAKPQCIILNCYNSGNIIGSGSNSYSGGLLGFRESISYNVSAQDCFSCSMINHTFYRYADIKTINCYNIGTLSGVNNNVITHAGTVTNCHYLNTYGGTGNGTPKTEAQMKSSSFPVILNTDSVVFVIDGTPNINQGYPIFGSVTTLDAENIGNTVATLKGNYQMLYNVDTHGFEYKKSNESNYTTVNTTGEGPVSYNVSGL